MVHLQGVHGLFTGDLWCITKGVHGCIYRGVHGAFTGEFMMHLQSGSWLFTGSPWCIYRQSMVHLQDRKSMGHLQDSKSMGHSQDRWDPWRIYRGCLRGVAPFFPPCAQVCLSTTCMKNLVILSLFQPFFFFFSRRSSSSSSDSPSPTFHRRQSQSHTFQRQTTIPIPKSKKLPKYVSQLATKVRKFIRYSEKAIQLGKELFELLEIPSLFQIMRLSFKAN